MDLQNKSTATYPGYVLNPEETDDDVVVRRPGQKLHGHRAELLQTRFRPVLKAGLKTGDGVLALAGQTATLAGAPTPPSIDRLEINPNHNDWLRTATSN